MNFGGTSGDALGLTSLAQPFQLPSSGAIEVAVLSFVASDVGSSVLSLTADPINMDALLASSSPLGSASPISSQNFLATINVIAPIPAPEPGMWLLLSAAILSWRVSHRNEWWR